jgi:hypothetical protein
MIYTRPKNDQWALILELHEPHIILFIFVDVFQYLPAEQLSSPAVPYLQSEKCIFKQLLLFIYSLDGLSR